MMFNYFCFAFFFFVRFALLGFCLTTLLAVRTLEGCYCCCCGYLVAAIHPKGCERVIYLLSTYLPS